MMAQLTLDISTHEKENNPISQAHLDEFKEQFSHDVFEVLKRLIAGERLSQRSAGLQFLSGDLRARIRDARNPNYGLGIPISDEWIKTDNGRKFKEYFMSDADKIEALKILMNKLKKAA